MKPLYIKFVNNGIANRFDCGDHDIIEMNWRIKKYPDFFNEVLMHELAHEEDNSTLKDFKLDLNSRTPGLFKFMRNHISSWSQVLPIYWHSKRKMFVYDNSAISSWIIMLAIATAVYLYMPFLINMLRWLL